MARWASAPRPPGPALQSGPESREQTLVRGLPAVPWTVQPQLSEVGVPALLRAPPCTPGRIPLTMWQVTLEETKPSKAGNVDGPQSSCDLQGFK